ncbi:YadA C-terminal domain-containing protein [Vibrio sp. E150_011]
MNKSTLAMTLFATITSAAAMASNQGVDHQARSVADRAHERINDVEDELKVIDEDLHNGERRIKELEKTNTGSRETERRSHRNTTDIQKIKADNAQAEKEYKEEAEKNDRQARDVIGGINDAGKNLESDVKSEFGKTYSKIDNNAHNISQNSAKIDQNSERIDGLEQSIKAQGEEMRERYDGVKATMHAVTNARPVAYDVGSFAVGAGIGAAGSKQAVALGGAYRFDENWSGSFTVSHETAGKQTKADTSAGVGAQYNF